MSHVRMWSVAFNVMVHSSEPKSWWVISCGWNLACLNIKNSRCVCHLNYFPAWHFRYSTFVVLTFRQLILTKSPCRWRTSINTQQKFGDWSNPHDLLLTQPSVNTRSWGSRSRAPAPRWPWAPSSVVTSGFQGHWMRTEPIFCFHLTHAASLFSFYSFDFLVFLSSSLSQSQSRDLNIHLKLRD